MHRLHRCRPLKDQRKLLMRESCAGIPSAGTCADFARANSTAQLVRDISSATSRSWDHVRTSHVQTLQSDHRCVGFSSADFSSSVPRFFSPKVRSRDSRSLERSPTASDLFALLRPPTCGHGSFGCGCGHWGGSAHGSDPHGRSSRLLSSTARPRRLPTSTSRARLVERPRVTSFDLAVPRPTVVVEPLRQLEDL